MVITHLRGPTPSTRSLAPPPWPRPRADTSHAAPRGAPTRGQEYGGRISVHHSTAESKQHNVHVEADLLTKGVPGEIRALLSPGKLKLGPKKVRDHLRKQTIDGRPVVITRGLKVALESYVKQERKKKLREEIGDCLNGSYGALATQLEKYSKSALVSRGVFNEHCPYILGEPLVVPETKMITISWSTENLLLNAYRQSQFGMPSFTCVDTTHRLIHESELLRLTTHGVPTWRPHPSPSSSSLSWPRCAPSLS